MKLNKSLWLNFLIGIATLVAISFQTGCGLDLLSPKNARRVTDRGFILRGNTVSPDGNHRILEYQYDTGAFGYSRYFWAVTPAAYEELDLALFELPDGYMTEGWSSEGELLVSKWTPYYFVEGETHAVDLKTGGILNGVKIRIVVKPSNQSDIERANSDSGGPIGRER